MAESQSARMKRATSLRGERFAGEGQDVGVVLKDVGHDGEVAEGLELVEVKAGAHVVGLADVLPDAGGVPDILPRSTWAAPAGRRSSSP